MGLAAAISTVPITAMLLILLSPRRKAAALPFLIGSVVGMLVVVGVCTLAAQALPEPRPRQPPTAAAVIELIAGVALIVLGVRTWLGREQADDDVPAWTKSIDELTSGRALGLGLLLALRPKNVLLAAVVGVQLHVETLDLGATIAAAVLYVVIATSSLTIPIVLTLIYPNRMQPRLEAVAARLTSEAPVISAVVLILIGTVVAGAGLQNL